MPSFIAEMNPITQLFWLAFLMSIVFGMVVRKTQFCPLGGVADYLDTGNTGRLWMYFWAIGTAILAVTFLEFFNQISVDDTAPPYRMSFFRWLAYIVGGMSFGIGMALCRGCGMRSIVNLGSGNLKAFIAICGMSLAAVLMLYTEGFFQTYFLSWVNPVTPDLATMGVNKQDLGTISSSLVGGNTEYYRLGLGILIGGALAFFAFRSADFRDRISNITGGFLIGILVVMGYVVTASSIGEAAIEAADFMDTPQYGMGIQSYTFIRPMGDLANVMMTPEWYLVTFGMVAFLGVGAGSLIWSAVARDFKFHWFNSPLEAIRYFVGGIMVGIGGILGMGCTLGQGIAGTSTLALGSFVDLFALLIGAYIGIKLQKNFMDDHCSCS